jgi:hypothetical protein
MTAKWVRDARLEPLVYKAYVLTLLPGRVFQVFQVAGGEEEREKGENIDNLFTTIISVHIYLNASPPSKHNNLLFNFKLISLSDDLT